ncbi:hypothetical protein HF520_08525 [Romboutsia sp. CE17]|uniref:hypothetical protein n=1 Tax=Romboutsia sp. CE17 TaxID=2724150 RepID=UPI001442B425|nr:hypothetical protein [Romboutsia sp. CE17]QJA08989.1 hypothetical protein HF520_08525 [Romboutsia sp. CE17]
MNKFNTVIFLSTTILFGTACSNFNESTTDIQNLDNITAVESKTSNSETLAIQIDSKDASQFVEIEYDANSTNKEKVNLILSTISKECFNGLPIKASIVNNNYVEINLEEFKDDSKEISWKVDYLNEYAKFDTINLIVKNILQDNYKSKSLNIKEVSVYYNNELITLD